jgi:stearoyl-CoA desaturase (delta-9 desaturase)
LSAPALTRPTAPPLADPHAGLPANAIGRRKSSLEIVTLYVIVAVPFLALAAVIPAVWGWGLTWLDVGLAVGFYYFTLLGVTVGYHRHFTHGSFKAKRGLRLALAAAGSMAIQGPVIQWVADHRRHHAFSDRAGDPHSPWRYGTDLRSLLKGMFHAHLGWLFDRRKTSQERYAPDLLKDGALVTTSKLFVVWAGLSLFAPAIIGGLVTGSWAGAWSAFFWAGLVRVALLHHVTWSINSVCHVVGNRPFVSPGRDRATNFWPLAILSAGESWHNLHHADPTCARHGVLRGQIDISARAIWVFEKLGWARDVKWPDPVRLAAKRRVAVPVPAVAPASS